MKLVIFYEKPFCAANAKQKSLLRAAGCTIIERNLLEHGLDRSELRAFMGEMPVSEWFNPAAPAIKNGLLDPAGLTEEDALDRLMNDPILIRRPLMIIAGEQMCGFDHDRVEALLARPVDAMPAVNCLEKSCLQKHSE